MQVLESSVQTLTDVEQVCMCLESKSEDKIATKTAVRSLQSRLGMLKDRTSILADVEISDYVLSILK
ncbi:MAG: hypothetical protein WC975_04870 [Phycisphaerae bacterium]